MAMQVTAQCVVGLTWVLKDATGDVLDELDEPVAFLVGGDDLLPAIDQALQGKAEGDSVGVNLEPQEAFGDYDENRVFLEQRQLFPKDIEPGVLYQGHTLPVGCSPDAPPELLYTVSDVYPDHVVLDGNHPLAGMALQLQMTIHAVREATVDEIGSGTMGAGFFKMGQPQGPRASDVVH
jgi:FKBP-type peptidyl-prolyl cis-trans isomerase SlyD